MNEKKRGKFIVFEGPDGFGKSTQAYLAYEYMGKKSIPVMLSKEPGSPLFNFTKDLREILFDKHYSLGLDEVEQGLIFFVDHYHHARMIESQIEIGNTIVSDRWLYSQYCYDAIKPHSQTLATGLYLDYEKEQIQPDLVLLFGLDKEEGYRRIKAREEEGDKKTKQRQKPWAEGDYLGELIIQYANLYQDLVDRIPTATIVPRNEETREEVFEKYVKPQIDELFKGEGE